MRFGDNNRMSGTQQTIVEVVYHVCSAAVIISLMYFVCTGG